MKLQECPASRDNKTLQSDTSAGGHPRVVTENMGDMALQKPWFLLMFCYLAFLFLMKQYFICVSSNRLKILEVTDRVF